MLLTRSNRRLRDRWLRGADRPRSFLVQNRSRLHRRGRRWIGGLRASLLRQRLGNRGIQGAGEDRPRSLNHRAREGVADVSVVGRPGAGRARGEWVVDAGEMGADLLSPDFHVFPRLTGLSLPRDDRYRDELVLELQSVLRLAFEGKAPGVFCLHHDRKDGA
jgi:hypothetical protein